MRLVNRLCVGACCLLSGSISAFAQGDAATRVQRLTEAQAVSRLMTSDPRVRAMSARIDEVRAMQAERVIWPNPAISYSRESVTDADDVFLVARQELPVSGRRGRLRTAGRMAIEAAQADARFQTIQLQADLRQAFTTLLLAQEREAVLMRGIEELLKLVEVLRVREQAGEGSLYDRMRGARALVDLEADLGASMAARARARGELAGYLGSNVVVPDTLVAEGQLGTGSPPPPVATLVDEALTNRADYRATELAITRFQAERQAAALLRVPTPTLSGGMKRSGTSDLTRTGYLFSLDLALPLFNRGQAVGALASAQTARAEAEAASSRVRIEAEVRAAHATLSIHQERAARYRQSIAETAEPLARIGRIGYEEGELGILELLDADRQALEARLRALDLTATARRAAIDLDRIIGTEIRP